MPWIIPIRNQNSRFKPNMGNESQDVKGSQKRDNDIRIFGKPEVRGHRRLGVILATADSVEEAIAKCDRAYAKLEIKVLPEEK